VDYSKENYANSVPCDAIAAGFAQLIWFIGRQVWIQARCEELSGTLAEIDHLARGMWRCISDPRDMRPLPSVSLFFSR